MPLDLTLPEMVVADHEERLAVARRVAVRKLGDPSYADLILDAYFVPSKADLGEG